MARKDGRIPVGLIMLAAGSSVSLVWPPLKQAVTGARLKDAGLASSLIVALSKLCESAVGISKFAANRRACKRFVSKLTASWTRSRITISAAVMLLLPLAMPEAGAVEQTQGPDLLCGTGSVCNQGQTAGRTTKTIETAQTSDDPYELYTLGGSEEGYVIGIVPSADNQLVKFGVFAVPDDFPWSKAVRIQKFKIGCARPVGGAYSRIEGPGPNLTRYWNVTCRILGSA